MRIGLDIDNVILDTDSLILEEMLKEDKNKRNKGIIDKNAPYIFLGMFDWPKEEIEEFLINNMERIASNVKTIKDSKKYIDKLLEEGHEIYLISNRAYPYYKDPLNTTKNNLEKNEIKYTKLILTETNDKSRECIDLKIDIMFDDRASNCLKLKEKGINCYLVKTIYETRIFDNLEMVNNFKEIYLKIKEVEK